ncbi:MAG: hypothetical protein FWD03_00505 [Defluviitaleaceae bacterium]|nr:hypothetical protein [Defluviitaleaceae bacterium]
MLYPYITLADDTTVHHSHLIERNGRKEVEIHFERPAEGWPCFDEARCVLPTYEWIKRVGHYSDEEIKSFEALVKRHSHLIYRYASEGGVDIA